VTIFASNRVGEASLLGGDSAGLSSAWISLSPFVDMLISQGWLNLLPIGGKLICALSSALSSVWLSFSTFVHTLIPQIWLNFPAIAGMLICAPISNFRAIALKLICALTSAVPDTNFYCFPSNGKHSLKEI
jgi:hypothetical protein